MKKKKVLDVFCWIAVAACSLVACLSSAKEIVYGALITAYFFLAVIFFLREKRKAHYEFCPHCREGHFFWPLALNGTHLCPGCFRIIYKEE